MYHMSYLLQRFSLIIPVILAFFVVMFFVLLLHFMTMRLDNHADTPNGNNISQGATQQFLSSGVVCPLHYLMFDERSVIKND